INPAALSKLGVAGYPSPTTAGVAHNFTVTAQDAFGNTAPTTYTGTVHFTSSDPAAVLPADYMFVIGDNNVHTFSATLKTSGSRSITSTDTVTSTITGTHTAITVNPAAPASYVVTGYPRPVVANSPNLLTVTAKAAFSNP